MTRRTLEGLTRIKGRKDPEDSVPHEGMDTPWGRADHVSPIIEGMNHIGTPSHGGIKLNQRRNVQIPDYMRRNGGWYEEDCEWSIPFVVFTSELSQITETQDPHTYRTVSQGEPAKTLLSWFQMDTSGISAFKCSLVNPTSVTNSTSIKPTRTIGLESQP